MDNNNFGQSYWFIFKGNMGDGSLSFEVSVLVLTRWTLPPYFLSTFGRFKAYIRTVGIIGMAEAMFD